MSNSTDIAKVSDPALYGPHRMGYACLDCRQSAKVGVAVRHSSSCDVAPREYVLPSDQAPTATRPQEREANTAWARTVKAAARPSLATVAREGTARLHYTDAEIVDAVRLGEVSMSDAMNHDC